MVAQGGSTVVKMEVNGTLVIRFCFTLFSGGRVQSSYGRGAPTFAEPPTTGPPPQPAPSYGRGDCFHVLILH